MALKQHGTPNSTCIKNKFIRLHYHSQKSTLVIHKRKPLNDEYSKMK